MKRIFLALGAMLLLFPLLHAALLFDDAEQTANSLGCGWISFTDGYSSVTFTANSSPGYAGNYCRRMDWTIIAGSSGPFVGITSGFNSGWNDTDLSSYYGVRFYAKGVGGHQIMIAEEETRTTNNHYSAPIALTTTWQYYEIPFSNFTQTWGPNAAWDPAKIYALNFIGTASPGISGNISVDNIAFYTQAEATQFTDPNVIVPQPKINQLGYLPGAKKYFTVVTNTASAGDTYRIFDSSGNTAVTGTIPGAPFDDRPSTGEGLFQVDFSGLSAPGTYHVAINGKESYPFNVAANVYDQLFRDSLRCFYLIRCGLAINDPVTGLNRNACHTAPDTIRGSTLTRDMSGGWHNAGDFGKWANEESISCAYMMWLYELKPANTFGLNNNIKESGNGVSDLLNEAKWGLDWMMKLQNPDGSVYHKSDTEPNFCWGTKPDLDPFTRYVSYQAMSQPQDPSSLDAADFTAAMAQASRVFAGVLPAYANQCATAALLSWNWLKNNRGIGQTDPYYTDAITWQEEEWAMAEIYRLTADPTVETLFDADTNTHSLDPTSWSTPEFFGYFSLLKDANTPASLRSKITTRITSLCDSLVSAANNSGYGVARGATEYYWESNEDVLHKSGDLLLGYEVTGNQAYKDTALNQLGYILGNNSLNESFVTKEGTNYASHPYNWVYYDYNILMPGWASGGPNGYATGAGSDAPLINLINLGTPPAKCWLDLAASNGSYASNEGETSENAALMFLTGYFYSVVYPATPTPTFTTVVATPTFTATPSTTASRTVTQTSTVPSTQTATQTATVTQTLTPTAAAGTGPATNNITAYPVPCNLTGTDTGITFVNLPAGSMLQVYDMKGEMVLKFGNDRANGKYFWILSDQKRNNAVAPGIYVYVVISGGKMVGRDKLAIIR
jgi:endoglucanase